MMIGGFPMTLPARILSAGFGTATRNYPSRRKAAFQLQPGGSKGLGHGGRRSNSTRRSRSGDVVRQSGIYEVIHDREHREAHEVVMISGESFPDCETCKEKVRFRLVRTAPYIFQDEDFEEEN
jgi:hypothetical protein